MPSLRYNIKSLCWNIIQIKIQTAILVKINLTKLWMLGKYWEIVKKDNIMIKIVVLLIKFLLSLWHWLQTTMIIYWAIRIWFGLWRSMIQQVNFVIILLVFGMKQLWIINNLLISEELMYGISHKWKVIFLIIFKYSLDCIVFIKANLHYAKLILIDLWKALKTALKLDLNQLM